MIQETAKIGKRGVLVIPAAVFPIERYTSERKAEFLLSNTVDEDDYARAVETVREMGIDPKTISHTNSMK